jgi:lysophospholipase L1-like esterase
MGSLRYILALLVTCFACSAGTLNVVGDSIGEGYPDYNSWSDGGPSGDTNYNIIDLVAGLGAITGGRNWAYPGHRIDQVVSTGNLSKALSNSPTYILLHVGINDIDQGYTWTWFESNLNAVVATCKNSNAVLIVDEIFPDSNASFTDAEHLIRRTWNTNLAAYCVASNIVLMPNADTILGTNRVSTGQLDNLKPEYNYGDNVHLSSLAYSVLATNIYNKIQLIERIPFRRFNYRKP